MVVERMGFIVYYRNKQVLKRLNTLPVNVSYISNKMNYAIFYGDKNKEKNYFNNLRKVKGFQKLEQQLIFNEELNFDVK